MKRYFPFRISLLSMAAALAALLLMLIGVSPLRAQTVVVQGAPRGTVIRPVGPPPPVPVTPVRVPPIAPPPVLRAPVLHPPVSPGVLTVRPISPAVPAVRPIIISPAPAGNLPSAGPPPFPLPAPIAPIRPGAFRLPPDSLRLLEHGPHGKPLEISPLAWKPLSSQIPSLPLARSESNPRSLASQPIVVPHLYCSPDSVLYNTGSICFDPNNETIDPSFYPWGLYAPPPFSNERNFVAQFPPGLLVQFVPQWLEPNPGLFPPESPYDRWRRVTSGGISSSSVHPLSLHLEVAPGQPAVSPGAKPAGPPVVLVLASGTTVLATRYWLGGDWMLHYISVNGQSGSIPIEELNLRATSKMNYARGVVFVMPGWPAPQSNR